MPRGPNEPSSCVKCEAGTILLVHEEGRAGTCGGMQLWSVEPMRFVSVFDSVTVRRAAGMQLRLQEASEDLHEHLRLTRCFDS